MIGKKQNMTFNVKGTVITLMSAGSSKVDGESSPPATAGTDQPFIWSISRRMMGLKPIDATFKL